MAATGAGFLAGLKGQLESSLLRSGAIKQGVGGSSSGSSFYKAQLQALRQSVALRQAGRRALGKKSYEQAGKANETNTLFDALFYVDVAAKDVIREAFTNVFRGLRQGSDLPGAFQARHLLKESKQAAYNQFRPSVSQSFKRPSFPFPNPNVVTGYTRSTTDVGLQLSRRGFHSGGGKGFETLINLHSPLALRAAADDLEKERKKAAAARFVGMSKSTRRSPYMVQKQNLTRLDNKSRQANTTHQSFYIIRKIEEKRVNEIREVETELSTLSMVNAVAGPSSESIAVQDEESESGSAYFEEEEDIPYCVTTLNIPLNPDQHRLLFSDANDPLTDNNHLVPFNPGEMRLWDESVVQQLNRINEEFRRHRTGLILQVERAFDINELLAQFRPESWTSALFVELVECLERDNIAAIHNATLRVDFPDLEPIHVRSMLLAAEISRHFVELLMQNSIVRYRSPPSSMLANSLSSSSSNTILSSPPPSSEGFSDVGRLGVASEVSMDDHIRFDEQNHFSQENQGSSLQLTMPTLPLNGS